MGSHPALLSGPRSTTAQTAGAGPTGPARCLADLHSISRRPRWLEALRRVLSRVDAAALFPRLDRGCNPTCAPAHQVLLSEVILGLRSPSAPVAGLFESELWDQVRSTAPLCSWINRIRKHGLVSTVEADDLSFRSTGPIWDLVTLGRYPNVSRALLQDLVMWLATYLRTVQTEPVADQAGQGPLMWSPASLTRSHVEFHYRDDRASMGHTATPRKTVWSVSWKGPGMWEPSLRGDGVS